MGVPGCNAGLPHGHACQPKELLAGGSRMTEMALGVGVKGGGSDRRGGWVGDVQDAILV